MYYLYDMFPKTGKERFVISSTPGLACNRYWMDKSERLLKGSRNLLIKCWERSKPRPKALLSLKDPFLCATGHSNKGKTTHYQPWFQIKAVVRRRGHEFHD